MAEEAPMDHKHLIKAVRTGLEAAGHILTKDETAALMSKFPESDVDKLVELISDDIKKGSDSKGKSGALHDPDTHSRPRGASGGR